MDYKNLISFIDYDLGMSAFLVLSACAIKDCYSGRNELHLPKPCIAASLFRLHSHYRYLPRKEVIQPHLPVRLPCYDFTPVTNPALGRCFQKVSSRTSGVVDFHGVTGGVYKTRERIQRSVLICVY